MAYELLTGRRPFKGEGPGAVIAAILSGRHVPLSEARRGLPGGLAGIVERCLEREPAARFQDGKSLARALRASVDRPESRRAARHSICDDGSRIAQEIRFCTTADGVSLAYSAIGAGPFIVRVLGHFTHLEMEWEWPDLRRFWEHLAARHTVVRYDGRGMGLSDPLHRRLHRRDAAAGSRGGAQRAGAEKTALLGISEGGWTAASLRDSTHRAGHAPYSLRRVLPRRAGAAGLRRRGGPGAR